MAIEILQCLVRNIRVRWAEWRDVDKRGLRVELLKRLVPPQTTRPNLLTETEH